MASLKRHVLNNKTLHFYPSIRHSMLRAISEKFLREPPENLPGAGVGDEAGAKTLAQNRKRSNGVAQNYPGSVSLPLTWAREGKIPKYVFAKKLFLIKLELQFENNSVL